MKIVLDSHTHTIASGHAYNTIMEMVHAASQKGLELLGITEHAQGMPGSCNNMYFRNVKVLPREMEGIEVLFGAEANILDPQGNLDMTEKDMRYLDVVIASLHPHCMQPGTKAENTSAYLRAMDNPYINIIGHPDDGRYPVDYEALVRAAGDNHVLLEVNNHSLDPHSVRTSARENLTEMLKLCMKYGVSIILDSDAHWCGDIANTAFSLPLLEEVGFPEELVVNRSVEEYKKYIGKR